jgi:hypothetical protein
LFTILMSAIAATGLIALPLWAQDPGPRRAPIESDVVVPDLLNKTVREARELLQAVGLTLELDQTVEDEARAVVELERPPRGTRVRRGSAVWVRAVMHPPAVVMVPDVRGRTVTEADLTKAGNSARADCLVVKDRIADAMFQQLLLRYTQALITQISQTAVCNRLHSVEQQLCRWLLLSRDRLNTDELIMTQELIADMLGVRREGVTEAAGRLQAAGLIHYSRGKITVLDRAKLEARVCECYAVVKRESDRLLSPDVILNSVVI